VGCDLDIATEIERFASAYEHARRAGPARVDDFLPPPDHSAYADIGVELLRIDLELAWQDQRPAPLDVYRRRFARVLDTPKRLEQLAFEDFRLRFQAGEPVVAADYAQRYGVDVTSWTATDAADASDRGNSVVRRHTREVAETPTNALRTGECAADSRPLGVAEYFPEFELIEELGRGAFARVFLARQKELANRPVALKISRGLSVEPDRLAQLQHANIVPIYSVHQAGDLQAVCMPYLGRSTLAHVMGQARQSGRLPRSGRDLLSTIVAVNDSTIAPAAQTCTTGFTPTPSFPLAPSIRAHFERASYVDAVVWIVARLADGLAHAHERGILHRDLKPANVLFSDDGRPMILDFNLSDHLGNVGGKTAAIGGTLPYMAPEHLESLLTGDSLDVSSDIYSLGVMFYELLTGQLPYQPPLDGAPAAIAAAVSARRQPAPSVRLRNSEVPASIAAVVARCLAPSSERRYRTAQELREDLDRHLGHHPLAHARDRSPGERIGKWIRRHPRASSVAAIGSMCLIVISLLGAGWLWREDHFGRVEAQNRFHDFAEQIHEA
jgi:eukaryotic-like serine/threonine-protein kinase